MRPMQPTRLSGALRASGDPVGPPSPSGWMMPIIRVPLSAASTMAR
jgi:hypothetical protein